MKKVIFYFTFLIFLTFLTFIEAVFCRTGVDSVEGPVVDCLLNQCLNTSTPDSTVYSCDYSRICDMMRLRNECVKEDDKVICCCFGDECNFGQVLAVPDFGHTVILKHEDDIIQPLY